MSDVAKRLDAKAQQPSALGNSALALVKASPYSPAQPPLAMALVPLSSAIVQAGVGAGALVPASVPRGTKRRRLTAGFAATSKGQDKAVIAYAQCKDSAAAQEIILNKLQTQFEQSESNLKAKVLELQASNVKYDDLNKRTQRQLSEQNADLNKQAQAIEAKQAQYSKTIEQLTLLEEALVKFNDRVVASQFEIDRLDLFNKSNGDFKKSAYPNFIIQKVIQQIDQFYYENVPNEENENVKLSEADITAFINSSTPGYAPEGQTTRAIKVKVIQYLNQNDVNYENMTYPKVTPDEIASANRILEPLRQDMQVMS